MVLLPLREAISCFVLDFKCFCIAVLLLLETLLPSDSKFAAVNLYLWPVSPLLKGRLTFSAMLGISHCNSLLFP